MAVDKLNYISPGKHAKTKALATLVYIGKDKEETPRVLFGHDGVLTKQQAEEMISNAPKNTYFWRLILSPDRKTENIEKNFNLQRLTKEFIEFLEVRLNRPDIPFIAAEHNNTDNPHTHTIFLMQRQGREMMITSEMLKEFYQQATEIALSQKKDRELFREPREIVQEQQEERRAAKFFHPRTQYEAQAPTRETIQTCPDCGTRQLTLSATAHNCDCIACGRKLHREHQNAGLSL